VTLDESILSSEIRGKRERVICTICQKPAVMYISKGKRIAYEHRDEPPIGEYWYRGKKYERYRRCDGGRIGKGLDELIAEGIENPEPELDVEPERAVEIKRKVGRPRKIPESEYSRLTSEQTVSQSRGEKIKRKVGRPRKMPESEYSRLTSEQKAVAKKYNLKHTKPPDTKKHPKVVCPYCNEIGYKYELRDGSGFWVYHFDSPPVGIHYEHGRPLRFNYPQHRVSRESLTLLPAPQEQKQTRPLTESEIMELKSLKKRILELENRRNKGEPYTRIGLLRR
jgi:hypothetical protein